MEYLNKSGLGVAGLGAGHVSQKVVAVYSGLASDVRDIAERFGIDDVDQSTLIFATLQEAIDASLTGRGDHIKVMPGHAETVATAAAITTTGKTGLIIEGFGTGDNRPVFTFSAVAATFALASDDCHVSGIVGLASADLLTNPFIVTGDGCTLDVEWQDGSASLEALTPVRLDTADNCVVKLRHRGFIAGNACTAAVTVDNCDGVRIDLDAYGKASVAWVNMVDSASTDVNVTGYMYNSGTTDGTKNVVDTITGSLWFASFYDGAAGARFSGGSAAALASDDVSAVAALHTVPSADASTNTNMRDVVGNKTDAAAAGAVSATESLMAYAKQLVTESQVAEATGDADIDISESDYTTYINILTVTAPATGLKDCRIDLDFNKATTGWDTISTAADTLDCVLVAQVDGTNYRSTQKASAQITANGDGSLDASESGVSFDVGPLGPNESVQVHVKLSVERADAEIPYRVTSVGAAPTITPVAAA